MALPLHPTTMLELFDADTATLQNMVRSMDAYLGSASAASSFDVDRVRRQRNQLGQELAERGSSEAILAPFRPETPQQPAAAYDWWLSPSSSLLPTCRCAPRFES